jgi:16S rRNA (cytosine967-C5)-methyltransferase
VEKLAATQRAILASASTLLKPGGRLVYATCSLLREENEDVVSGFLATHPDFAIVPAAEVLARRHVALLPDSEFLRLLPHRHGTDGFYAMAMERRS